MAAFQNNIEIGTITAVGSGSIEEGANEIRTVDVELAAFDDIRKCQWIDFTGSDSPPVVGAQAVTTPIGDNWYIATHAFLEKSERTSKEGEKRIFSLEAEADAETGKIKNIVKKAELYLKNDGKIELNGSGDFAVLFTQLQTEFKNLQDKYNNHTHLATLNTSVTPNTVTSIGAISFAAKSNADITKAKCETVELPAKEN